MLKGDIFPVEWPNDESVFSEMLELLMRYVRMYVRRLCVWRVHRSSFNRVLHAEPHFLFAQS